MSDSDDKSIILHQRGFPLTNSSSRKSRISARRSRKRWIQGTLVTATMLTTNNCQRRSSHFSHGLLSQCSGSHMLADNDHDQCARCELPIKTRSEFALPLDISPSPPTRKESIWRIIWEVFWNRCGCFPSILNLISGVLIIHDQISETFLPLDLPPGVCGWEPVVLAAHANPFIDRSHQARKCTKAAKPAQKFLL